MNDTTVPSVGLVVIATGRYLSFLPALAESARKHVTGLRRIYVLSEQRPSLDPLITWLPWGHTGWPFPTLLRYRAMTAYADVLRVNEVVVYVDVDMRFVAEFDVSRVSGLFAVRHPGFLNAEIETLPYERNPESRACVAAGTGRVYFAGGVQGGSANVYLSACREMASMIQSDLDRDVIPVWHDESVWNAQLIVTPPQLDLSADYCTPEGQESSATVLVALNKDHDHFREVPRTERLRAKVKFVRKRVRSGLVARLRKYLKLVGR